MTEGSSGSLPDLPASFSKDDLMAVGFEGWQTWDQLRQAAFTAVPSSPAAYVIYRRETANPAFLNENPGGRFKGRDPTIPVARLTAKWVAGASVIYLGKADAANRRLEQFGRFGAGEPVGHWGGRLIWQLADSTSLLVAWHRIAWGEPARAYEKRLLTHFEALHGGMMPFANLSH